MKFKPTHKLRIEPDGGKLEEIEVMCLGPLGTKDKKADPGPLLSKGDFDRVAPLIERRESLGVFFVTTDPLFEGCEWSYDDMGNMLRSGSYAPWGLVTGSLTLTRIEGSTIPKAPPKVNIPDIGIVPPEQKKKKGKKGDDKTPFDPVSETELDTEALVDGLDDD